MQPKNRTSLALVLCAAGAIGAGGCAQVERGFAFAPGGGGAGLPRPDGAAWSEAVFDAPMPGAYLAMVGGSEVLPEYVRRDEALGVSGVGPVLATNQWPVPTQPELEDTRYLWLPTYYWYGGQLIPFRRR